jgi:hypothetical protein
VILDRSELYWQDSDKESVIVLKTFAPLTGYVVNELNLLEFPIKVNAKYRFKFSDKYHISKGEETWKET